MKFSLQKNLFTFPFSLFFHSFIVHNVHFFFPSILYIEFQFFMLNIGFIWNEKVFHEKKKMHFLMKMNSNMGWDILKKKVVNSETHKEKNVCLHIIKNIRFFHHHSCMFNNSKIWVCKIIRLSYSICLFCVPYKICNFRTIKFLFPA